MINILYNQERKIIHFMHPCQSVHVSPSFFLCQRKEKKGKKTKQHKTTQKNLSSRTKDQPNKDQDSECQEN